MINTLSNSRLSKEISLPADIMNLMEKKLKYRIWEGNTLYPESNLDIPSSPLYDEYRQIYSDMPHFLKRSELQKKLIETRELNLRWQYKQEIYLCGMDNKNYVVYIGFEQVCGESIYFIIEPSIYDPCHYEFSASYFLPYYQGIYITHDNDLWEGIEWLYTYHPQNEQQREVGEIFRKFFQMHGHTEIYEKIADIELPIVWDHIGWPDNWPYKVRHLLFWE